MSGRPRRSAALRANVAITDMAETSDRMSSRSDRRAGRVSRGPPSSPDHLNFNIKVSSKGLRQATGGGGGGGGGGSTSTSSPTTVGKDGVRTRDQISVNSRDQFEPGEIVTGKRNRGVKRSYVVESSEDEEDEDAEGEEDDEMADPGDEDAEGDEDDMDLDAEGEVDDLGEEDAEGDIDMDTPQPPPTIKVSKPAAKNTKVKLTPNAKPPPPPKTYDDDDDDDDELSDLEPSDIEETITYGNATLGDEDAEGEEEEIQVAGGEDDVEEEEEEDAEGEADEDQDAEGEEDDGLGSEGESHEGAETPDLSKMTRRQRARFEDTPQEYMKLSNEVQVKKHFTAEEHAMRRAEMARRRRNLSEKRTEEVKMETINKLLKKQAPKTNRRAGGDDGDEDGLRRPDPTMYRWISDKNGSRLAMPQELIAGHQGTIFRGMPPEKMVQEVP